MARTFKLYKKGTAEPIKEGASPLVITGIAAGTVVAKGDYQASAIEDGKTESDKVDVDTFTVPAAKTSAPTAKPTATADGASIELA